MQLDVLRARHLSELDTLGRSSETLRFYQMAYRELEGFYRDRPDGPATLADLNRVTRADLMGVIAAMKVRGLAPGGVHAVMRGVRAIFNWGFQYGLLEVNAMDKVKLPSVPKKLQPCVQPDLASRVLRLTDEDGPYRFRNRAMVSVLYDTGLRRSEIAHLCMPDVDLKAGVLRVRSGKGERDRVVPFGIESLRVLNKYARMRRPAVAEESRFFLARGGTALSQWALPQVLEDYALKLQVPREALAPHAWRRGFAVQYLRNGGDLFALQQLLGHTSLDMTRKYVNYLESDLQRAHKAISPMDRLERAR